MSITAGQIMDTAASLLNDTAKTVATYAVQLPYLKVALKELREEFELYDIPVTQEVSGVVNVPAGNSAVRFDSVSPLPVDLIEIKQLWERAEGIDPFIPMTKVKFIPHYMEGDTVTSFRIWAWIDQEIRLLASSRDNDLKLDYIKQLFGDVVDQNSTISVVNADTFLHYRTAGLIAQFVFENKTRADDLNGMAVMGMERATGISTKEKQAISTRHRPFRASYKMRSRM